MPGETASDHAPRRFRRGYHPAISPPRHSTTSVGATRSRKCGSRSRQARGHATSMRRGRPPPSRRASQAPSAASARRDTRSAGIRGRCTAAESPLRAASPTQSGRRAFAAAVKRLREFQRLFRCERAGRGSGGRRAPLDARRTGSTAGRPNASASSSGSSDSSGVSQPTRPRRTRRAIVAATMGLVTLARSNGCLVDEVTSSRVRQRPQRQSAPVCGAANRPARRVATPSDRAGCDTGIHDQTLGQLVESHVTHRIWLGRRACERRARWSVLSLAWGFARVRSRL